MILLWLVSQRNPKQRKHGHLYCNLQGIMFDQNYSLIQLQNQTCIFRNAIWSLFFNAGRPSCVTGYCVNKIALRSKKHPAHNNYNYMLCNHAENTTSPRLLPTKLLGKCSTLTSMLVWYADKSDLEIQICRTYVHNLADSDNNQQVYNSYYSSWEL